MTRFEGWETILTKFIVSRSNEKFKWGKHDCCLFACDGIEAITGDDSAYMFRDKYKDKTGAYSLLKDFSGGGLEETAECLAEEFGMDEVSKSFAGRGDVALCNVPTVINEELPTLGIIGMSGDIYIAGTRRLQVFSKESGFRFWKV
mgnify:CR=1 FL=1